MNIQALNREDLQQLLELYSQLNEDDSTIEADLSESIWNKTIESKLIDYLGLFLENQLVSVCQMLVVPNLTRGGLPYCLIENVVSHKDFRNRGYGKLVLKEAIDLAWSRNCYKVMLMSGRKEESVAQFYRSVGFSDNQKQAYVVRAD